jgi:hypothetical protein
MQAPRSLRCRMLEAAIANDVPELERLRQLDMATKSDYQTALLHAISHESTAAAIHLWNSLRQVLDEQTFASLSSIAEHIVSSPDQALTRLALESSDSAFVCKLAEQEPAWILKALHDSLRGFTRSLRTNHLQDHLYALVHLDHVYNTRPEDRKALLFHALHAALVVTTHPWQGRHACILHLLDIKGATPTRRHLMLACHAFDRCQQDEERDTLRLLLERISLDKIGRIGILRQCCEGKTMLRDTSIRFLFDSMKDHDPFFVRLASQNGTCATLEACLERTPYILGAALSDRILFVLAAKNRNTPNWSRALGNVMEHLLSHATQDGIRHAFAAISHVPGHAMYLFLLEPLRREMVDSMRMLDRSSFCWLLQRNRFKCTTSFAVTSQQAIWEIEFQIQQGPIRGALLLDTPLAADLVCLVMQYV